MPARDTQLATDARNGLTVGAPLEGAAIGGAVGAGTGAVTSRNQIDLGRPAWE